MQARLRQYAGVVGGGLLVGVVLLGGAGTAAWWNAWLFVGLMLWVGSLTTEALRRSPGLAAERRSAARSAPAWDRRLVRLTNLALPLALLTAAADHRWEWLPRVPPAISAGAFVLALPATLLTYRAMRANPYFSSHIRIQSERGHSVVSQGAYRYVRHPGYVGAVSFNLLVPLVLGSWASAIPCVAAAILLAWRTAKEDALLRIQLPGYAEYATRVRHRLLPGLW